MIRKANKNDIDAVEKGYIELLTKEKENGSTSNWVLNVYPTIKTAEDAFNDGSLYVYDNKGEICASVILNQNQPDDYKEINWRYKADDNDVLVIHTLCVSPKNARMGIGRKIVGYAIDLAKEMNCNVIRLDTYAENVPASNLYKSFGFEYAGEAQVMLAGLIPEKQIFFEKNYKNRS